MRKGERAVLAVDVAWGARRAAAPRAEPEHDRNMDLAAAAEAIGDCRKWQRIFGNVVRFFVRGFGVWVCKWEVFTYLLLRLKKKRVFMRVV